MNNLNKLIEDYVNPENDVGIHEASFDIINKLFANENAITIQDIIFNCEKYLVSSDDKERYRATLLIADILHFNSSLDLNSSTIHLLIVFFNQRLSDYPTIIPSLQAIIALVRYHSAQIDTKFMDYIDIFKTIFKDIYLQNYAQNIRQKVYELFYDIMIQANVKQCCSTIGNEIMDNIISCFEGEKDPRCLVIAFRLIVQMIYTFADQFTEELASRAYESFSPYFPITFQAPEDDPYGVKPQDLITGLQDCFCCHNLLLEHVIPYMIDQLYSDLSVAKCHALRCLTVLCQKYSVSIFMSTDIIQSNKPPITKLIELLCDLAFEMPSADVDKGELNDDVKTETLIFIHDVAKLIGESSLKRFQEDFDTFGEVLVAKACSVLLENRIDSLKCSDAVNILCSISSSSVVCSHRVIKTVLSSVGPEFISSLMWTSR